MEEAFEIKYAETVDDIFYKTEVIPEVINKYFKYNEKLGILKLDQAGLYDHLGKTQEF
jgi:hypothetical protein